MTTTIVLLLVVVTAVAAFIQGASGLGFALVVAPVAGITAPEIMPVALLVLMLPLNGYVAWRERQHLDLRGFGWISAARLAATPLGLLVLAVVPADRLGWLIGGSTILAALISLVAPSFSPSRAAYLGAGVVTGLSETATGVGGPPLALVYQHRPAPEMRATIALCFFVGEIASLVALGFGHRVTGAGLSAALWLLPGVLVGTWLSSLVHDKVRGRRLRLGVLAFAIVSGVVVLASPHG